MNIDPALMGRVQQLMKIGEDPNEEWKAHTAEDDAPNPVADLAPAAGGIIGGIWGPIGSMVGGQVGKFVSRKLKAR